MRSLKTTLTALGIAALLASPAWAQRGGGMFGGPAGLLSNKSVQEELKLDDKQVEKAKELADKTREKMTALRESSELQNLEGQERFTKMQELMKPINEETTKAITALLKPEQNKRYQQIGFQMRGAQAFGTPELQSELKITDAQKEKIKTINEESQGKMRDIFQETQGDRAAMMEKMTALRKETLEKVVTELNDDQKKAWKEKLGAPFEFKPDPPANN
jgi:Spy/CpxP family protein refolding chaperone